MIAPVRASAGAFLRPKPRNPPPREIGLGDFARIPVEGLALVALAVLLPTAPRRVLAVALGLMAAALAVLRGLGRGFDVYFDRTFRVLGDWSYLPKGYEVVRDTDVGVWRDDFVASLNAVEPSADDDLDAA